MSKQRDDGEAITLRDWFAGQALSGLVARGMAIHMATSVAYQIADEMMKTRKICGSSG